MRTTPSFPLVLLPRTPRDIDKESAAAVAVEPPLESLRRILAPASGNLAPPSLPKDVHALPLLLVPLRILRHAVAAPVVVENWKALLRPRLLTTVNIARTAEEAAAGRLMPLDTRSCLVISSVRAAGRSRVSATRFRSCECGGGSFR